MKVVILAGGYGTGISEETIMKPESNDSWKTNFMAYNEKLFILWA